MREKSFYKEIGFKCGLEIHQRLATEEKLFCPCSANMGPDQLMGKIEREQRAVAGELGAIDLSTLVESGKKRRFIYNLYNKGTCLVDIDEEPPHSPNKEALRTALIIASSLKCELTYEIEPMRKAVVDGSDPSAFQRSMLVGYDGHIEVKSRRVAIPSVFLEEESGGIEENDENSATYNLDRLGIPLIEIDTDPSIEDPVHAKEVAKAIGLILRITGMVQRGIGSIRQDVNISIKGGERVEIKGFQDLDKMDLIIDTEINRHIKLLEIKEELAKRKARVGKPVNVTGAFTNTNVKILDEQIRKGGIALAVKLEGYKGLLGMEIAPETRLGSEISGYAKTAGAKGIIHSDENLKEYGFSSEELEWLSKDLGIGPHDAFIIIAESAERCGKAMEMALKRAEIAKEGVPPETRSINMRSHATRFLRPMPGGSRMYPETDLFPISAADIAKEAERMKVDPDAIWRELEEEIGNRQLAEQMLWSKDLQLYKRIVKLANATPFVVASVLLEKMRELKRNGVDVDSVNEEALVRAFELYSRDAITRTGIEVIIRHTPSSAKEVERIVKEEHLKRITGNELAELVSRYGSGSKAEEVFKQIMLKYKLSIDAKELKSVLGVKDGV